MNNINPSSQPQLRLNQPPMPLNYSNLNKLADYLEANVTDADFDMQAFRRVSKKEKSCRFLSPTDCGTCGCALGYAPLVEGLEPLKVHYKKFVLHTIIGSGLRLVTQLDFTTYARDMFEFYQYDSSDCSRDLMTATIWDFLFSEEWVEVDNTVKGAVSRIRAITQDKINLADYSTNDVAIKKQLASEYEGGDEDLPEWVWELDIDLEALKLAYEALNLTGE